MTERNKYSSQNETEEENKYSKLVDEKIQEWKPIDKIRKLDENNPVERSIKFDNVKKHPAKKGYMKVDLVKDKDDNIWSVSHGPKGDGPEKRFKEDLFFTVDLNTAILADIAACPSNVVPMLIDQAMQLVMNEKKEFKPEKRSNEFNWWWIVFGLCMLPGIIIVILLFMSGG